jgi:ATP/maltotriose-dependent transcriptional regulator MalT
VPAASTLIVDDVHAVASDTFAVLLSAAAREAPRDVALVMLSRHDPTGPLLEQAGTGAMTIIDAGALAFTGDEAATLLADRMDAASARGLHARTQGWVDCASSWKRRRSPSAPARSASRSTF